jgi:hypothetical protein
MGADDLPPDVDLVMRAADRAAIGDRILGES